MCKHCPRNLGVKRYWYLPHWSGPNLGKTLVRYATNTLPTPLIVAEYECAACDFVHVGQTFFKFRTPVVVDGSAATHYSTCPDKTELVYLRGM